MPISGQNWRPKRSCDITGCISLTDTEQNTGKEIVMIVYRVHSNEFSGPAKTRALCLIHYLRRTGILDCLLSLVCVISYL